MFRRLRLPIPFGRASPTRRYAPARFQFNNSITDAPRVTSRTFSSSRTSSSQTINDLTGGQKTWYPPNKPHDWNCMCRNPNARLTKNTLLELLDFTQKLDPSALSYSEIDAAITHSLEYLRASDVPSFHLSCCAHTLGQYHSEMAFACLAKIITSGQLDLDPRLTTRLSNAVPDIYAWLYYTFTEWLFRGRFIGRENKDRIEGFRSLVPFLDAAFRLGDLRKAMLEDPKQRRQLEIFLYFCWQMESEDWFDEEAAAGHFPFISASSPYWTLMRSYIEEGRPLPHHEKANTSMGITPYRDFDDEAKIALRRLEDAASLPLPALAGHIGILNAITLIYPRGLLWQHSIGKVTRLLGDITSVPYSTKTASAVEQCIFPCLFYLFRSLKESDGRSFVAEALHSDLLPALVRASQWITLEDGDMLEDGNSLFFLVGIMSIVSTYCVYPSVYGPFMASLAKLNLKPGHHPIYSMIRATEMMILNSLSLPESREINLECKNCKKTDITLALTTCDKCFQTFYCSEECKRADSESHREFCEKVDKAREVGNELSLCLVNLVDIRFAIMLAIAAIRSSRAEIVEVWRRERPERVPVVSVDYTVLLFGDLRIGEDALSHLLYMASEGFNWEEEAPKEEHDEHALLCLYLPHGQIVLNVPIWIPINPEYSQGTVVERLIQTVENCGDMDLKWISHWVEPN
ncbi:hypothetical protein C8R46DRAFT_1109375 [Mycena filopes]|nr:hypothetical protein C8R46DRAFT_1109375 [Mycena filopes]